MGWGSPRDWSVVPVPQVPLACNAETAQRMCQAGGFALFAKHQAFNIYESGNAKPFDLNTRLGMGGAYVGTMGESLAQAASRCRRDEREGTPTRET